MQMKSCDGFIVNFTALSGEAICSSKIQCCDLNGLFQGTKYSNYLGLCHVMKMFDRYGTAVKHKATRFYYNLQHTVEHAI